MKEVLENWRKYVSETNKIRRIKSNILTEITEEELREFPLSNEELVKIKRWAGLSGDPLFLGSGTMGSAYQFGDEVLKVTKDFAEASAAQSIAGQDHANVYTIKKVGRRFAQGAQPPSEMPEHPFLIVYDFVGSEAGGPDLPSPKQQEIIKTIHARPDKLYYNWLDNFNEIRRKFAAWVKSNRTSVEKNPMSRFQDHEKKLRGLMSEAGLNELERDVLAKAWATGVGVYSADNINTSEGVLKALSSPMLGYVDDISSGLTFLEQNGIHFRDLKTTNVMNDNGRLIIIDIGKSDVKKREPIGEI
jgi:serine/threonine protein kinase